ncbi:hypothetical protein Mapa_002474 [Marchantia paleacea]|nr:hypothetical protein Mapa_002474 [Marchantia paleacea]
MYFWLTVGVVSDEENILFPRGSLRTQHPKLRTVPEFAPLFAYQTKLRQRPMWEVCQDDHQQVNWQISPYLGVHFIIHVVSSNLSVSLTLENSATQNA